MLNKQSPSKVSPERIQQPPTVYFVRRQPDYLKKYLQYDDRDLKTINNKCEKALGTQFNVFPLSSKDLKKAVQFKETSNVKGAMSDPVFRKN